MESQEKLVSQPIVNPIQNANVITLIKENETDELDNVMKQIKRLKFDKIIDFSTITLINALISYFKRLEDKILKVIKEN